MRQLNLHLIAIGLLALAAVQLQPKAAQACIKPDRAAELTLIDDAIASDKTPDPRKAVLRALRKEMSFLRDKTNPTSDDTIQYNWLAIEALKLVSEQRGVATGTPNLDVGVFKKSKLPKLAQRGNDPIAIPRC